MKLLIVLISLFLLLCIVYARRGGGSYRGGSRGSRSSTSRRSPAVRRTPTTIRRTPVFARKPVYRIPATTRRNFKGLSTRTNFKRLRYTKGPREIKSKSKKFKVDVNDKVTAIVLMSLLTRRPVMRVRPYRVYEYDDDDNEISKHHRIESLDNKFTMTDPVSEVRYGLNSQVMYMNHTSERGTIMIQVIVFEESGRTEVESGEEFDILTGAMKISVEIKDWKFCGGVDDPCLDQTNKTQTGKGLEFALAIEGRNGNSTKLPQKSNSIRARIGTSNAKSAPETMDVDGSEVILSKMVMVDGTWQDMPTGYPKPIKVDGKMTVFLFRFPRFNESVYYDPIGQDTTVAEDDTSSGYALTNSFYMALVTIVLLLFKLVNQA